MIHRQRQTICFVIQYQTQTTQMTFNPCVASGGGGKLLELKVERELQRELERELKGELKGERERERERKQKRKRK